MFLFCLNSNMSCGRNCQGRLGIGCHSLGSLVLAYHTGHSWIERDRQKSPTSLDMFVQKPRIEQNESIHIHYVIDGSCLVYLVEKR